MRARLRDPVVWTDAFQLVKTVGAAVLAWVVAVSVLDLPQSFLAPWAALLTVHATVYRTFAHGMQQVVAAVLGVLLAFAAGAALGVNAASLAIVLLVAMVAGTTPALRAESTTAAATALVVLLTGVSGDWSLLGTRLADTLVGIAVGLGVNLVVWPPLRDRTAARRVDAIDGRLGELLTEIADGLREGGEPDVDAWVQHSRRLDHAIDDAWAELLRAQESGRLNLRRAARPRVVATQEFGAILTALEQAVAEARSLARTVARAGPLDAWDPAFRAPWQDLMTRAGEAVSAADADAIDRARADVEALAGGMSRDGRRLRPVPAALLVNLRTILEEAGPVASAQPVRPRAPRRPGMAAHDVT